MLLKSIPCDLSSQAYCDLPGSLYPWNAVRRFVNENQGMMKRMYGDVRHISVLRSEINNNDITLDDIEEATARYSRAGWKRNKYQQSAKSKTAEPKTAPEYRRPTNRSNDRSTKPRVTSTTTAATTSRTTTITTANSLPAEQQSDEPSVPSAITAKDAKKIKPMPEKREKMTTITVDKLDALEPKSDDPASYEEIIEAAIEEIFINSNGTIAEKPVNATESTKQPESSTEAFANSTTTSYPELLIARVNKSETAATISTTLRLHGLIKDDRSTTAEPIIVAEEDSNVYTTESSPIANITNIGQVSVAALTSTGSGESDGLNGGKDEIDATGAQIDHNRVPGDVDAEDDDDDDALTGELRPDDDASDSGEDKKPLEGISVGQLYQDVAEKEDPIIVDSRGV